MEIYNFQISISGTDYEPESIELTMSQAHTIARERARQHNDREIRLYGFNKGCRRWELCAEYKYNHETRQVDRTNCWRPLKPGEQIR